MHGGQIGESIVPWNPSNTRDIHRTQNGSCRCVRPTVCGCMMYSMIRRREHRRPPKRSHSRHVQHRFRPRKEDTRPTGVMP